MGRRAVGLLRSVMSAAFRPSKSPLFVQKKRFDLDEFSQKYQKCVGDFLQFTFRFIRLNRAVSWASPEGQLRGPREGGERGGRCQRRAAGTSSGHARHPPQRGLLPHGEALPRHRRSAHAGPARPPGQGARLDLPRRRRLAGPAGGGHRLRDHRPTERHRSGDRGRRGALRGGAPGREPQLADQPDHPHSGGLLGRARHQGRRRRRQAPLRGGLARDPGGPEGLPARRPTTPSSTAASSWPRWAASESPQRGGAPPGRRRTEVRWVDPDGLGPRDPEARAGLSPRVWSASASGIPLENAHRASHDAEATGKVLYALARRACPAPTRS